MRLTLNDSLWQLEHVHIPIRPKRIKESCWFVWGVDKQPKIQNSDAEFSMGQLSMVAWVRKQHLELGLQCQCSAACWSAMFCCSSLSVSSVGQAKNLEIFSFRKWKIFNLLWSGQMLLFETSTEGLLPLSLLVSRVPVPGPRSTESCAFPPVATLLQQQPVVWRTPLPCGCARSRAQPSRVCHLLCSLALDCTQLHSVGASRSAFPNLTPLRPFFSPCVRKGRQTYFLVYETRNTLY